MLFTSGQKAGISFEYVEFGFRSADAIFVSREEFFKDDVNHLLKHHQQYTSGTMFIITDTIRTGDPSNHTIQLNGRRFYRSRNTLAIGTLCWDTSPDIPADVPIWEDMFSYSARAGFNATKQSLKPAIFVWAIMAMVAILYYAVPASQSFFVLLSKFQERMGLLFPFLGMGLSVGIMAEIIKVLISKEKRWTRANTTNAVFNFFVFGILGVVQTYFYMLQVKLFGAGTSLQVLVPKVLFDQFVWTVIIANPYQTVLFVWKNEGFSWKKVVNRMLPLKPFWGIQILPVLITNWAFWIPMVAIIYCFPPELQLPLAILAVTIWVLMLSILTSSSNEESSN